MKTWEMLVQEDSDGEPILVLPEELEWQEGDIIDWDVIVDSDGVTRAIAVNKTKRIRDGLEPYNLS